MCARARAGRQTNKLPSIIGAIRISTMRSLNAAYCPPHTYLLALLARPRDVKNRLIRKQFLWPMLRVVSVSNRAFEPSLSSIQPYLYGVTVWYAWPIDIWHMCLTAWHETHAAILAELAVCGSYAQKLHIRYLYPIWRFCRAYLFSDPRPPMYH